MIVFVLLLLLLVLYFFLFEKTAQLGSRNFFFFSRISKDFHRKLLKSLLLLNT